MPLPRTSPLLVLTRQRLLPRKLLLRLLVPMHNQLVQETARLAVRLIRLFRLVRLSLQVARRLVVDVFWVVVGAEVRWEGQRGISWV